MDFDDAMFVGADTAGPDPVMQTCDEDDQAAMESVLFRFNASNEIESVEEKRAPSTLASMDFDDDMFADAAGEDIPEPVMQTCDEDDQAAMESVLSTFGSKKIPRMTTMTTAPSAAAGATFSPAASRSSPASPSTRRPRTPRTSWTPAGTCPSRSSRPGRGPRTGVSDSTRRKIY
jgi:hypothetical protein